MARSWKQLQEDRNIFRKRRRHLERIKYLEKAREIWHQGLLRKQKRYILATDMIDTLVNHGGQATKSAGWMPWHWEPTKDVISCDKLRRGANIHRPADF